MRSFSFPPRAHARTTFTKKMTENAISTTDNVADASDELSSGPPSPLPSKDQGWAKFNAIVARLEQATAQLQTFARFVPPVRRSIGNYLEENKATLGLVVEAVAREFSHQPSVLQPDASISNGLLGHPLSVWIANVTNEMNVRYLEDFGEDSGGGGGGLDAAAAGTDSEESSAEDEASRANGVNNRLSMLAVADIFLRSLPMASSPPIESFLKTIQMDAASITDMWRAYNERNCSERKQARLEHLIDAGIKELRHVLWSFFDLLMQRDEAYFGGGGEFSDVTKARGFGHLGSDDLLWHVREHYQLHPLTPSVGKPFAYTLTAAFVQKRDAERAARNAKHREYVRALARQKLADAQRLVEDLEGSSTTTPPPIPSVKKAKRGAAAAAADVDAVFE